MDEKEKLLFYIKKLEALALEKLEDDKISAMQALKESLNYIEGELIGY